MTHDSQVLFLLLVELWMALPAYNCGSHPSSIQPFCPRFLVEFEHIVAFRFPLITTFLI